MCTHDTPFKEYVMSDFPSIGIREFRENLHKYTAETKEPFAVTSHGRHIGYYIPVQSSPSQANFEALKFATQKLQDIMADMGLTEDEVVAQFDRLRKQARKSPRL
jgi:hypothetical protein